MRLVNQRRAVVGVLGSQRLAAAGFAGENPVILFLVPFRPGRGGNAALANDVRAQPVNPVHGAPHWNQGCRADDERITGLGVDIFELHQNLGADAGFAQADHVADITAAVFGDDVQAAPDVPQLEVGQLGDAAARRYNRVSGFAVVEFVEGFDIDVVRGGFGNGPGTVEFRQGQRGDVGGVLPEFFKPGVQCGDFAPVKADVQFGAAGEPGREEVRRLYDGRALDGYAVLVADVGFGVPPLFEAGADFQPAGGDQVADVGYALLFAAGLRRGTGGSRCPLAGRHRPGARRSQRGGLAYAPPDTLPMCHGG